MDSIFTSFKINDFVKTNVELNEMEAGSCGIIVGFQEFEQRILVRMILPKWRQGREFYSTPTIFYAYLDKISISYVYNELSKGMTEC